MLRVAVIGAGPNGSNHARGLARMDDIRVVGVADIVPERAALVASEVGADVYATHHELLDRAKPDAVWVSSPNWLHPQHVVDVAERGIHVMSEKPMGLSLEDCDRMIAAADGHGAKLNIAQTTRYILPLLELKRVYESGECGELASATSVRMGYHTLRPTAPWRLEHDKSGSCVFEWEIHEIDFVRSIGGQVTSVYAQTMCSREEHPTFLDHFSAVMAFAGSGYGHVEASQSCLLGQSGRFFVGSRGTARAVSADVVEIQTVDMDGPRRYEVADDGMTAQARQDADFIRAIREDTAPPVPGVEGRINVEIALAIIASGGTGDIITLPMR
ncbi:MAG: Gfo/Idh/MocA family oxidoreductase [Lentisphaerae bacterium]|jgi:UDP-N-acetylglucosamine 3-dehydrogenase|nr:Gfo/Idh/MocA family oxidoreductase [Lentisphaerota bacterium]MBT4821549.1 Gfo/Idh/MocA family oxidoreductase [Lentisphaerota bacterium]MBT5610300.1 Gfo/Idh/MocA family oxidoreductase [Lentisphaerota bacterium]MBT7056409.1 Gfo/Idh/MocA family oxidoreductase [Lentisphaerota bacterium]MBT7848219.1 Gfo/Idh/MocA family oxidoreductase [Lentisphaerota bacterium]